MSKEPNRNVYVGHRYVPLIMGEWDKSIKYEGLSIVLHEGSSYTSKGYVPVGIDIKNKEYWALTGNYNAQVEGYRMEVEHLTDDVVTNSEDINTNKIAINDNKTDITNKYNENKGNIQLNKNDIDTLKDDVVTNSEDINANTIAINDNKTDITNKYNENKENIELNKTDIENLTLRSFVTPDDFEGSDGEKIEQSMVKAINEGISLIVLTRTYDLTGHSVDLSLNSYWHVLTFVGGKIVKNDNGYVFHSTVGGIRNSPQFIGTHFSSTPGNNVYLFNGDNFIRQNMTNCYFLRMGLVESTDYLQSIRLMNCETGQLNNDFIKSLYSYDCKIIGHRGEESSNHHFINIVSAVTSQVSYIGLSITDSLFEGYTQTSALKLGTGYSLNITGTYFEANMTDIEIVNPSSSALITGSIDNNIFNNSLGEHHIVFKQGDSFTTTHLSVAYNTVTSPNKNFINRRLVLTDLSTNRLTMSNTRLHPTTFIERERNSHTATQVNNDETPRFKFEIPLNRNVYVKDLEDTQYLINLQFTFQSSALYRGHLTGILSIDNYYDIDEEALISGLNFTVLSTRGTPGTTTAGITADPVFEYYFEESGTKTIDVNANKATIVIDLPKAKYNVSNSINVKAINKMIQRYFDDY